MTRTFPTPAARHRDEMIDALTRLDHRLAAAVTAFDEAQGGPTHDRYRGLVIAPEEPRRLLARDPGSAAFTPDDQGPVLWPATRATFARQLAAALEARAALAARLEKTLNRMTPTALRFIDPRLSVHQSSFLERWILAIFPMAG